MLQPLKSTLADLYHDIDLRVNEWSHEDRYDQWVRAATIVLTEIACLLFVSDILVWWCQAPLALCMLFGTLIISKRFLWDSYSTYQLHHATLGRIELPTHSSESDGKRKKSLPLEQKRKRVTAEEFDQQYNRPMSTQDYDPEKSWIPRQVFESKGYAIFPHDSHHLVEREFDRPDAIDVNDAEIPFEEGSNGSGTLVRRSDSRQSNKSLFARAKTRHTSAQVGTQKTRSRTRWRNHPVVAWVSALIGIDNALQGVSPQANSRRRTVWELQVWKYSKLVRDLFIFFSPLKMFLYFIALYGSFTESLLLIMIAYMHCGIIYVLCSSYEARERDQSLINAEAYFLENKVNREPAHSVYLNFAAHQANRSISSGEENEPMFTPSTISPETVQVIGTGSLPDTPVERILPVSRKVSSPQVIPPLKSELKNAERCPTTADAKTRTVDVKMSPPNIFQKSRNKK